jgi:hypothetical protein
VEPAVGALRQPHQQRVGRGCGRVDVDLQDPVVADEHDQLAAAAAGLEPVQLTAGDLRHPLGPDAAPAKGVPQLPPHRQRVGPGRNWNSAATTAPAGPDQLRMQPDALQVEPRLAQAPRLHR